MKPPEHAALSYLLAQFGTQEQYGLVGTSLVLVAGCLPDLDGLSLFGGWQMHRTYHGALGHGILVTLAAPAMLAWLGSEVLGLGPLLPLWIWLQVALVAHLVTDLLFSRWPIQLLWPFSARKWGLGLIARNDLFPGFVLYGATAAALCLPRWSALAAGVGIGGLTLYLAWRGAFARAPLAQSRETSPRLWQGCTFFTWICLLARNRFAIHPSRWHIASIITIASLLNTILWLLKAACYDRHVRKVGVPQAPIFIIGHWRTGTTLVHELLILDDRHAYATTYQCLAANHFLLTEGWLPRLLWFLMPSRRLMDNMAAGWDRPQEDEVALCTRGQPSPYLTMAYPNHGPQFQEYLDLEDLSPRKLYRWKAGYLRFLQEVAFKNPGKRLVLKSPTHTCRIKVLQELFPEACFVHVVRDPYDVFPSTVHLWKTLFDAHSLEQPTYAGLEDHVFRTFIHMHERLEKTRPSGESAHFHQLRYEDLIRDPMGTMERLYVCLRMDGFEAVRPRLRQHLPAIAGYQTNRYELPARRVAEITAQWGDIIRKLGYQTKA